MTTDTQSQSASGSSTLPDLDVDATIAALHAEAARRAGHDDFGSDDYRRPFRMLIESMKSVPMSESGRALYREELVLALVGRLVREAGWKAHPAYRDQAIERPLIICGIPRTGTTALHKLLSIDPQFQGLNHWLTAWPMPRPPYEEWKNQPGYQFAAAVLAARLADAPGFQAVHEVVADEVDECLEVLRYDFVSNRYSSMVQDRSYDEWMQAQDETPFYHRLADTLRLIGLNDDRTWLLKNPGHFAEMEALLSAFPDARVVITHRDPVKSMGSLISVLSHLQRAIDPQVDLTRTGPRELAYWAKAKRATEAVRARQPVDQFYDVDHLDFHRDPIGTVRGIYDHFGLTLTADIEQAMRGWLAANPADKHGAHRYALEDFGLNRADVAAALQEG